MKRLAVQDANVLIDLWDIGLLEEVFDLDLEMHSTDFVVEELRQSDQRMALNELIAAGKSRIHTYDARELQQLIAFSAQQGQLSLEDCSVWKLAEEKNAMLLTADGALRRKARAAGIEVHGSLWLLDKLVRVQIIPVEMACQALLRLQEINPRLPAAACAEQRNRWCLE